MRRFLINRSPSEKQLYMTIALQTQLLRDAATRWGNGQNFMPPNGFSTTTI